MTQLPRQHPLRRPLHNEAHARPPEALTAPSRISFLALFDDQSERSHHENAVHELCGSFAVSPPAKGASHFSGDLGAFRLKWEKHTEFTRYKFIAPGGSSAPFTVPALSLVPQDWLASLPGQLIAGAHVELIRATSALPEIDDLARRYFAGNALVGAHVADRAATAYTDFQIHADDFGRVLILDHHLAPRQAGRTVQRLLEIDAYRMLSMMALPVARSLAPQLATAEQDLVDMTSAMSGTAPVDEHRLLERLTRLEAQIQKRFFETSGRFSAADAYYALIRRRTEELREERVQGVQTFREFIERRLGPAMSTCQAVSRRQEKLSERVALTTQLLSTRVDVSRQRQNQGVLESMNRRALLQLRLQQTVEGLSVAAITYYVVGLIGYVAKGLVAAGMPLRPDLVVATSVPVVILLVAVGVRRIRRWLSHGRAKDAQPTQTDEG